MNYTLLKVLNFAFRENIYKNATFCDQQYSQFKNMLNNTEYSKFRVGQSFMFLNGTPCIFCQFFILLIKFIDWG